MRLQSPWTASILIILAAGVHDHPSAQELQRRPCPKLPNAREIEVHQRLLETRCASSLTDAPHHIQSKDISTSSVPPKIEWIIQVLTLELSVNGGVGWRLYRPLSVGPTRLPQAAPPPEACEYHFSLFERRGRVWALERWTSRPPSSTTPRSHSLSHPKYTTSRLLLSISAEVSNASRWEITPQGVVPSLLPAPLIAHHNARSYVNPDQTHPTPTHSPTLSLQSTAQLTPLLGCGSGAAARDHSSLTWSRHP